MSDVSVIGLGAMGSALARALQRNGHSVTVWNRTSAKAEPLVRDGAILAPDPASAVAASHIVLVCVDDYKVTRAILSAEDVVPHLSGRVLVQLSSGTPQEAREMERRVRDSEALYLDGAIWAYPEQMGAPEASLLVAGAEATFWRCEPLLRSLAGDLTYLGEQVGVCSALDCAVGGAFLDGALLGALHGAHICEAEGLRVDEYTSILAEVLPTIGADIKRLGERIQEDRYDGSQSTLRTYAIAAEQLVQQARESGMDPSFPTYASGALQRGMDAGLGGEDLAALIKVLRVRKPQSEPEENMEPTRRSAAHA